MHYGQHPYGGMLFDTAEEAISSLYPPNEPLTLDELREMDGEPVWVEHNNGGEWIVIHWDYVGRITTAIPKPVCSTMNTAKRGLPTTARRREMTKNE